MFEVESAGFLIFKKQPSFAFLLMQHATRWDLPKGQLDDGETIEQCAIRELEEETGIAAADLAIDPEFLYQHEYKVMLKRFPHPVNKRLTIYLGTLLRNDIEIKPTEHMGFKWVDWSPPHKIQQQTIDPLLAAAAKHFEAHPERAG